MSLTRCFDCGSLNSPTAVSCIKCGRVLQLGEILETEQSSAKHNSMFRILALIVGAVAFTVITFIFIQPILGVLRSIFPVTASQESIGWRAVITITSAIIYFTLYALAGIFFGYVRPEMKWKWGLWLAIFPVLSGVVMLLFMGIKYPATLIFGVSAVIAGGSLGAQIGAYFKQKSAV